MIRIDRRTLLGGAVASVVAPSAWASAFDVPVAIVGGGLAGLTAALTLQDAGIACQVLEANRRLGGRIFSTTGELAPGLVIERGGALIDTDHHDVLALAHRFGLPLFDRLADERAHPETPVTAFQFAGRPVSEREMADRLRPLAKRLKRDARRLDRRFEVEATRIDGMSVHDYLDQLDVTYGPFDSTARALCEAVIRSDYGVEPATSSALELLYSLPRVRQGRVDAISEADEVYSIVGGNAQLVDALATALPEGAIATSAAVTRIEEQPEGGFRLGLRDGSALRARFVIVTIPFTVLRHVALEFQEPRPRKLLEAFPAYRLGRNEKLIIGVDERIWQTPQGFRGELWSEHGLVWEASRLQPDHPTAALTIYLGGTQVDALDQGLDAPALAKRLAPTVPRLSTALTGKALATKWRSNPYSLGAYTSLPPGLVSEGPFIAWPEDPKATADAMDGLGCRGLLVAGEHLSEADYGYMNGAAETGRRAAQTIARSVALRGMPR